MPVDRHLLDLRQDHAVSTSAITVLATFRPDPDHVDEVLEVLADMVAPTRGEPGNQTYDLYRGDAADGALFHLFEVYDDDEALQAHRDSEHYRAYRAAIGDLLAEPIGVALMSAIDVAD